MALGGHTKPAVGALDTQNELRSYFFFFFGPLYLAFTNLLHWDIFCCLKYMLNLHPCVIISFILFIVTVIFLSL